MRAKTGSKEQRQAHTPLLASKHRYEPNRQKKPRHGNAVPSVPIPRKKIVRVVNVGRIVDHLRRTLRISLVKTKAR